MSILALSIDESIHSEGIDKGLADEIKEIYIPFSSNSNNYIEVLDTSGNIILRPNQIKNPVLHITNDNIESTLKNTQVFQTIYSLSDEDLGNKYGVRIMLSSFNYQSRTYILLIGVSLSSLESFLFNLKLIFYITIPIVLLLSSFIGWFFSKQAYNPVNKLIESSNYITAEKLDKRLPVNDTGDEISRLAISLNHMIERLENSFGVLKQFTSDASHELRTPLTILRGEIEVTLNKKRDVTEYESVLNNNLEEILRLQKIVDGLLLLAQLDSGKFNIENKKIDPNELLTDAVSKINALAKKKCIKIIVSLLENDINIDRRVLVNGDYALLLNVLLNLLDNAVKYSPFDSEINCSINTSSDDKNLRITIKDKGIGISRKDLSKIFERFYKVDLSRTREHNSSIGLGLAISKAIVQAHRGKLEADSTESAGSQFSIILALAV